MKKSGIRLGRIFGIELRLDYTWFIIFVLVAWSLAAHYFPDTHPGWTRVTYWVMGVLTSILFFVSVVIHELAHSLVSQSNGIPVHSITLYIFGGAAHISEEPKRARDELLLALAGPGSSLVIAALFGFLWWFTQGVGGVVHALAGWLGRINLILGLFNLIPGLPLDGGRVFRAIVWHVTNNLRRATQLAAGLGRIIAFGFIFIGLWQFFSGNWANGLWIAFIGWFMNSAAVSTLQQVTMEDLLKDHIVREVMMTDCPHVTRQLTLDVVIEQVVLPSGRRCFPVIEAEKMQGLLTLHNINEVPRDRWPLTRVEDVMIPMSLLKTVGPEDKLTAVFTRMAEEDINQYPVMQNGWFMGMIARDGLMNFIRTLSEIAR